MNIVNPGQVEASDQGALAESWFMTPRGLADVNNEVDARGYELLDVALETETLITERVYAHANAETRASSLCRELGMSGIGIKGSRRDRSSSWW